jgi:hypothetical protein
MTTHGPTVSLLALAVVACACSTTPSASAQAAAAPDTANMKKIEESVPVNDPTRPDLPVLNRSQVWQGLVMKAEDATRFVPIITYCKVIERFEGGFIREVNLRDGRMRERVTLTPEQRVRFEQLDGPLKGGMVDNSIDEAADGKLSLRFAFYLPEGASMEGPGRPPGGPGGDIKSVYRQALENTLATVRQLAKEGKL